MPLAYNLVISCGAWRSEAAQSRGSLTSLREKLIKIGRQGVSHGRY